jgi:hypothetical protein
MTRPPERESFGDLTDRLFRKVQDHMKWNREKTNQWFLTPNPFFGGMSPNDYLLARPDKIERVIDAMISGDGP